MSHTKSKSPRHFRPKYDYYVILDFEATCSENKREVPPQRQEIIEFPSVLIDARQNPPKVVSEIQTYVRPVAIPKLTTFCTQLTGITQETVDKGTSFVDSMQRHMKWLSSHGLDPKNPHNFAIVTCGDWDLKSMLPRQLKLVQFLNGGPTLKSPPCYRRWINIKQLFSSTYHKKARGMTGMLDILRIPLEGRHHSGIDDCRNIAKIMARLLADGAIAACTTNQAFEYTEDPGSDATSVSAVADTWGRAYSSAGAKPSKSDKNAGAVDEQNAAADPSPGSPLACIIDAQRNGHRRNGPNSAVDCSPFDVALREIEAGRKKSHWVWYVWPSFIPVRGNVGAHARKFLLRNIADVETYLMTKELVIRLGNITRAATDQFRGGVKPQHLFGRQHKFDAPKFVETVTVFHCGCTSVMLRQNLNPKIRDVLKRLQKVLKEGLQSFRAVDVHGNYFQKSFVKTINKIKTLRHYGMKRGAEELWQEFSS